LKANWKVPLKQKAGFYSWPTRIVDSSVFVWRLMCVAAETSPEALFGRGAKPFRHLARPDIINFPTTIALIDYGHIHHRNFSLPSISLSFPF
jgi:hypothetical protein